MSDSCDGPMSVMYELVDAEAVALLQSDAHIIHDPAPVVGVGEVDTNLCT